MSKKWEWIGDPAGILTGFTGDDSQQPGAHLLEFPERKVRALADLTVSLADLIVGLILKFSKHAWGKLIFLWFHCMRRENHETFYERKKLSALLSGNVT